jgi:hypothetical protein
VSVPHGAPPATNTARSPSSKPNSRTPRRYLAPCWLSPTVACRAAAEGAPGPPWRITAGFPAGSPAASQYTRCPSPASKWPRSNGCVTACASIRESSHGARRAGGDCPNGQTSPFHPISPVGTG